MPRLDGSGPWGMGPGTGWGMGPCCGGGVWRRGMGAGFGSRRFYTKKEEQEDVENEIKIRKDPNFMDNIKKNPR